MIASVITILMVVSGCGDSSETGTAIQSGTEHVSTDSTPEIADKPVNIKAAIPYTQRKIIELSEPIRFPHIDVWRSEFQALYGYKVFDSVNKSDKAIPDPTTGRVLYMRRLSAISDRYANAGLGKMYVDSNDRIRFFLHEVPLTHKGKLEAFKSGQYGERFLKLLVENSVSEATRLQILRTAIDGGISVLTASNGIIIIGRGKSGSTIDMFTASFDALGSFEKRKTDRGLPLAVFMEDAVKMGRIHIDQIIKKPRKNNGFRLQFDVQGTSEDSNPRSFLSGTVTQSGTVVNFDFRAFFSTVLEKAALACVPQLSTYKAFWEYHGIEPSEIDLQAIKPKFRAGKAIIEQRGMPFLFDVWYQNASGLKMIGIITIKSQ